MRYSEKVVVPGTGANSNNLESLQSHWNQLNNANYEQLHEILTQEECGELFDTLAEWNRYLEEEFSNLPGVTYD